MVSKDTPAFGPYVIQRAICTRPGVELLQAMFFNAGHRHRPVALRRTRPLHDGEHDKLVRAACAYAILQHADVVPVLDFGSLNNRTYIATPLVEGHNLLQVMARCAHRRQPFPFDVALFMTCRTLCALQYAHDHDQTHGDVSPTNVMVTREGKVQLADFGIRMASTRLRSPAGLNRGIGRRFACYLSPEQAQGDGPSPQADVFVAGILLYELLTGHVLFSGVDEIKIVDTLAEGAYKVPIDNLRPDLHPALVRLVRQALAPAPKDRFPDARAFLSAIQELVLRMGLSLSRTFVQSFMRQLFPGLRSNYCT